MIHGFPGGSDSKESACSVGDPGLIPELGRSPGEENGYPLQYSCLEKCLDRGAWRAIVHGIAKSQTWLKQKETKSSHYPLSSHSYLRTPQVLANTNLFCVFLKLPVLDISYSWNQTCGSSVCDICLWLSIMFLRFVNVVASSRTSLILTDWIIFNCMDIPYLLIHSSFDGNLACCCLVAKSCLTLLQPHGL